MTGPACAAKFHVTAERNFEPAGGGSYDAIHPRALAQAPERGGAVVLHRGAVDADIAEHSLIEAREHSPVAQSLIPGDDVFDQSDQHTAETGAKRSLTATCTQSQHRRG
jgi:hypothetical protein